MNISGSSREILDNVQTYINSASNPFENALNYHQKEQQIISLNQKIDLQQRIFSLSSFNTDNFLLDSNICNLFDEIRNFINLSFLKIYDFDMSQQEYKTLCVQGDCEGCIEQLVSDRRSVGKSGVNVNPGKSYQRFLPNSVPKTVVADDFPEEYSSRIELNTYFIRLFPEMENQPVW